MSGKENSAREKGDITAQTELRPPGVIGRKVPVHGVHVELGTPTLVYLTVCTKDRRPWLNCDDAHALLNRAWQEASNWMVGRYVLMPDHLHLFCAPVDGEASLESWIRFWKSSFSRAASNPSWRWQSQHWDTRIRRCESYGEKWDYVRVNPVRKGLVRNADDWPYQGELNSLQW